MEVLMATKKQLYALYCIYKQDFRNQDLTREEASALISQANNSPGSVLEKENKSASYKKSTKPVETNWVSIYQEAKEYASESIKTVKPTPMIVSQHSNPLNDRSPVIKEYYVESGICGNAFLRIPFDNTTNRKFVNALKKAEIIKERTRGEVWKHEESGYMLYSKARTQSYEINTAWCNAVGSYLDKHGISTYVESRLD